MTRRLSRRHLVGKTVEIVSARTVRPPRHAFDTPGYLRGVEGQFLYWLARRVPSTGRSLEVGFFKGRSSVFISSGLPQTARLACVDTWHNDTMPYDTSADSMPAFEHNVAQYRDRIDVCRGRSTEVARNLTEPVDLLFIDGDHSYEGRRDDILAWQPFGKRGGVIAFHDASEARVTRAIEGCIPRALRRREVSVWSILAFVYIA